MKHEQTEQWLTRMGAEWRYHEAIPLSQIDVAASLNNQARLSGVLDPDLYTQYGLDMIEGAQFPALIGHRDRPSKPFTLIDGNHRVRAGKEAGVKTVDVYEVVGASKQLRDTLTRAANAMNGARPDAEEREAQAVHLITTYGLTLDQAAASLSLNPKRLAESVRYQQVVTRLTTLGAGAITDKIARTGIIRMHGIKNDNVLKAFAELAAKARVTTPMQEGLQRRVTQHRTEADQLAAIESIAKSAEIRERIALSKNGTRSVRAALTENGTLYMRLLGIKAVLHSKATPAALAQNRGGVPGIRALWKEVKADITALLADLSSSRK